MGQQFGPPLVGAKLAAPGEGAGEEVFKLLYGCEINVAFLGVDKVTAAGGTRAPSASNDGEGFRHSLHHVSLDFSYYGVRLPGPHAELSVHVFHPTKPEDGDLCE